MVEPKVRILFDIDREERLVPFFLPPDTRSLAPTEGPFDAFGSIEEAKGFLIGMGLSEGIVNAGGWQKIFSDGEKKAAAETTA